jgi:hypothetical protein
VWWPAISVFSRFPSAMFCLSFAHSGQYPSLPLPWSYFLLQCLFLQNGMTGPLCVQVVLWFEKIPDTVKLNYFIASTFHNSTCHDRAAARAYRGLRNIDHITRRNRRIASPTRACGLRAVGCPRRPITRNCISQAGAKSSGAHSDRPARRALVLPASQAAAVASLRACAWVKSDLSVISRWRPRPILDEPLNSMCDGTFVASVGCWQVAFAHEPVDLAPPQRNHRADLAQPLALPAAPHAFR